MKYWKHNLAVVGMIIFIYIIVYIVHIIPLIKCEWYHVATLLVSIILCGSCAVYGFISRDNKGD